MNRTAAKILLLLLFAAGLSAQAQVTYVGLIGNGLYQMNLVVPALADGDHEVVVTMGTESSPRGKFIPVKR